MKIIDAINTIKTSLVCLGLDLIFPQRCVICREPVKSAVLTFPVCISCDKEIIFKKHIDILSGINIYSIANFEGTFRKLIHVLKYKKIKVVAKYLSLKIFDELEKEIRGLNIDIIIPVPVYKKKIYERGFNQTEILAKYIGRKLNIPVYTNILLKIKETDSQAELELPERILNLYDCFKIKKNKNLKNIKKVLLVDDVFTTGSTIGNCISIMKKSNYFHEDLDIKVIVVCKTVRVS